MSASRKVVDARGLPCPQPVVLTRKALAEGRFELLEVLVDDASSRENVERFAAYTHCTVEQVVEEDGAIHILIRPGAPGGLSAEPGRVIAQPGPAAAAQEARGTTLLITRPGIGAGDDQLGALLMRGFLHTLTEAEQFPARIILMNGGVQLAAEGSEHLVNLRRLEHQGVEILVCGTCLEFYALRDRLAVGRVTNLYEITGLLLGSHVLTF